MALTSHSPAALGLDGSARGNGGRRILKIAPTSFFADYGCHVRILEETRALVRSGQIPSIRLRGRIVVSVKALEAFVAAAERAAAADKTN